MGTTGCAAYVGGSGERNSSKTGLNLGKSFFKTGLIDVEGKV